MKNNSLSTAFVLMTVVGVLVPAGRGRAAEAGGTNAAAPVIQFETNFYDFGRITAPGELSGVFKFKNVGQGVLKLQPPAPSCGCTVSQVKPNTLAPGQGGEITYTITLDHVFRGEKTIRVRSNDPKTPEVVLTMAMDFKPLYEVVPKALRLTVPPNKDSAEGEVTVFRTDGLPVDLQRLGVSAGWVKAVLMPPANPLESTARIHVSVHRPVGATSMMSSTIELWNTNQSPRAMQTVLVLGDMQSELSASPPQLYWVIPDFGNDKSKYTPESLTRTVELKSVLGNPVEIKQTSTSIPGLDVKVVPKGGETNYDLVLHFEDLPQAFAKGKVLVETSAASLPKLEVPLTVAVPAR